MTPESSREKAEKEAENICRVLWTRALSSDPDSADKDFELILASLLRKEREAWNACLDECKKVINQEGKYRHFWMKETMIMLVDQLRK